MSEYRCEETGRRYRESRAEGGGPVCREYAPAGPEGEAEGWPWRGKWYCAGDGGPSSLWYTIQIIGFTPEGGTWLAWSRCNPPNGYAGLAIDRDETTLPLLDEEEQIDTQREIT